MINYWRTADDDNNSNDDNSNNDDANDNNNKNNNNSCNGKTVLHLDFIFLLQVGLQFVLFCFCTSFFFLASLFSVFCFIAVLVFLPKKGGDGYFLDGPVFRFCIKGACFISCFPEKNKTHFFILVFLASLMCSDLLELEFKTLSFFPGNMYKYINWKHKGKATAQ